MTLHVPTLILCAAIVAFFMGIVCLFLIRDHKNTGVQEWALGLFLYGTTATLFLTSSATTKLLHFYLAMLALSASAAVFLRALGIFFRIPIHWSLLLVPIGIMGVSQAVYLDDFPSRLAWNQSVIAAQYILMIGFLWFRSTSSHTLGWGLLILGTAVPAIIYTLRSARAILGIDAGLSSLGSTGIQVIALLAMLCFVLSTSVGIILLHRDKERAHLKRMALEDKLTGIYNRHALLELAEKMLAGRQHQNLPVGMLFMDIDHFKKLNDSHGHIVGDKVLKVFCGLIQDQIRKEDIFGRFGGEEFIVIVPATNQDGVMELAERIRSTIDTESAASNLPHFTVSIGVHIAYTEQQAELDTMIKHADDAMYQAKSSGRNKVMLSTPKQTDAAVMPPNAQLRHV